MKKVLKIVGIILGGLLGIILCIAAWVAFTGVPKYESKSLSVQIPTDSAALHAGKVIVEERCAYCHYGADGKLSGRQFTSADDPFGEFWSKNITKDKEFGIGAYSDGQLAYLLRTGINRHGYYIGPWMSSVLLSDQDLGAVIAYLRSDSPLVAPSQATHPGTEPNFLVKALLKFGAFTPLTYDGRPVTAPAPSKSAEFGKYLITARYNCFECHSANFESNDQYVPEKSVGYLAGGNLVRDNQFKIIPSANITMSPTTGIGTWSYEQFNHAIRTGERPDGKILSAAMPRMSMLDEVEIQALWAYLQTVPVIEHKVAR